MKKPNIIILVLDQLRVDRLPYFKEIAGLKSKGVFFSQMIAYAPYTVASLHSLFSGMYGTQNGVDSYYGSLDFDADNCFTLAQYLKENGYSTKADILSQILIPHSGFDEVLVHDENKDDLRTRHKELIKEALTRSPFFLFLHYSNIHTGVISEIIAKVSDFEESYFKNQGKNLKRYDGFVNSAALYFQEIMGFCRDQGLFEDTIFIVMTDHGCSLGEKPGERCYGVFTYDYTVRTFAYFVYQGVLPQNKEINVLTRVIDITPTILDILGISPKEGYKKMQGESLYPMMLGKDLRDREAYIETAGLTGPYPSPYKPNICAYRTKEWKLIYNEATGKRELYNLKDDPQENNDLTGKYPEVEDSLWLKMKQEGGRVILEK
ncbi:MAG: sulfatase-like hydrolase/transferase [Candidatus Omnitrophota bacterium]